MMFYIVNDVHVDIFTLNPHYLYFFTLTPNANAVKYMTWLSRVLKVLLAFLIQTKKSYRGNRETNTKKEKSV